MIDLDKRMKQIYEEKKYFNYTLKNKIHCKLYDVAHPLRERTVKGKRNETLYLIFKALILEINGKPEPHGKHSLELPAKRAVYPLYWILKDKGLLNEDEIEVTIDKRSNYDYGIELHNN